MVLRVVVYFGLMVFVLLFVGGLQQEVGLPDDLMVLFQWAPGIAGLLTMLIFRRRDAARIAFLDPDMPLRRYVQAFLVPASLGVLSFAFALVFLGGSQSVPLTLAGIGMMTIGAVGEEIGWRGYLHRRIAPHMSGLTSSLVVGLLWTAFHLTMYIEGGALFIAFMALAFVSMSIMAYAALADYAFNVLGATVFHLAINLTSSLVFCYLLGFDLAFVIAAAVVLLRRDLFFTELAPAHTSLKAASTQRSLGGSFR